jgi:hypothetical protein
MWSHRSPLTPRFPQYLAFRHTHATLRARADSSPVPIQSEANPRIKQRVALRLALLQVDFGALSLHCNALAIATLSPGTPCVTQA